MPSNKRCLVAFVAVVVVGLVDKDEEKLDKENDGFGDGVN
jgi:hypothetical protein